MSIKTIVAGTDGSPGAAAAVQFAADLALETDARLVVTTAAGLLAAQRSPGPHTELWADLDGRWTAEAKHLGAEVVPVLRDGNAVTVLLSVAEEFDADLIVVGSRGAGGFPQLLLGSTSVQLAQRADRPVVIVPLAHR